MRAIDFVNANTGWIAVRQGIFGTDDGGTAWKWDYATRSDAVGVVFLTPRLGWALVDDSPYDPRFAPSQSYTLVETTDAGASWHSPAPSVSFAPAVEITDLTDALAAGSSSDPALLSTSDGGLTWEPVANDLPRLRSIALWGPQVGWALGVNFVIYGSEEGRAWNPLWKAPQAQLSGWKSGPGPASRLWATSPQDLWLLLERGQACASQDPYSLYRSNDGGRTWLLVLAQTGACLVEENEDVADGTIRGPSGYPGTLVPFNASAADFFVTSVAEATFTVATTLDGGVHWKSQGTSPVKGRVMDAFFTDATTGWALTSAGEVLHTTDGSATWSCQFDVDGSGRRCS